MYVFLFSAHQPVGAADKQQIRESDIYCWIRVSDYPRAELKARRLIHDAGWTVRGLIESCRVQRSDYEEDERGKEIGALYYFDEAVQEGATMVIWCHDEDADHRCPVHDVSG